MIQRLIISLLTIAISIPLAGQCPSGTSRKFESQQQLTAFLNTYPNCTDLSNHDIYIKVGFDEFGPAIHDLSSLKNITSINSLSIVNNNDYSYSGSEEGDTSIITSLYSLTGLEKLRNVGSLTLDNLPGISDLDVLADLEEVNELKISSCLRLKNADALEGLSIFQYLQLFGNENLTTVGLIKLAPDMERIIITHNPKLSILEFENEIETVSKNLSIDMQAAPFLSSIKEVGGSLHFTGSETRTNLSELSSLEKVVGKIFLENLSALTDLSFFSTMDMRIKELRIMNCSITSLNGMIFSSTGETIIPMINLYHNESLEDISVLGQFKHFKDLALNGSPLIDDLTDFSQLESTEILSIGEMDGLTNLLGLDNLKTVTALSIGRNNELLSLTGLEQLENLGSLNISQNAKLMNLDPLAKLRYIEYDGHYLGDGVVLSIRDNPQLESILGLSNAFGYAYSITTMDNPLLDDCSIPIVCNALEENTILRIENNGNSCQSEFDIAQKCGSRRSVKIFYDENQNGLDDDELGIPIGSFNLNNDFQVYPGQDGQSYLAPFTGLNTLEYKPDPNWNTTTPSIIQFQSSDPLATLKIGIYPTEEEDKVETYLVADAVICNQQYEISVFIHNLGSSTLVVDQSLEFVGKLRSTSLIDYELQDNVITYSVEDVRPGEHIQIRFSIQAPDVEDLTVGALSSLELVSNGYNNGSLISEGMKVQEFEFLCSYDPNDKQVIPSGVDDQHYTLFQEEELQFNIRFQNTGNYHAEDVIIRDTLSEHLDLNTFKLIGASHSLSAVEKRDHIIAFRFDNIYLPDSTTNLEGSNGYVSYSIRLKEDLPENTRIENTAHIYFDSNPAIVTNTTLNTMVTELPIQTDIEDLSAEENQFTLIPNPANNFILIDVKSTNKEQGWKLFNLQGICVLSGNLKLNTPINTSDLNSGLYLMQIGTNVKKLAIQKR